MTTETSNIDITKYQGLNFNECCNEVLKCKNQIGYMQIAKGYASAGRDLHWRHSGDALKKAQKTQALYILNNIAQWRGDNATKVRISLKLIGGVKLKPNEKKWIEAEMVRLKTA